MAAQVTFIYQDPESVRQYEAYVTSLTSPQRCSRLGNKPPLKCLIRGLKEATEYVFLARVCLLGKPTCEHPIKKTVRTELKGSLLFKIANKHSLTSKVVSAFHLKAPTVRLAPLSLTAMRLTFHPPKNQQADYYEANFINSPNSTLCRVAASASPLSCTFGHLKPDSFYKFDYYAGAKAPRHDIWSDVRQISGRTRPYFKSQLGTFCIVLAFTFSLNVMRH